MRVSSHYSSVTGMNCVSEGIVSEVGALSDSAASWQGQARAPSGVGFEYCLKSHQVGRASRHIPTFLEVFNLLDMLSSLVWWFFRE